MIARFIIFFLFFTGLTSTSVADEYSKDLEALTSTVRSNQLTKNGYWLEMKNAFGEWEKMILVFGYYDPGDEAACATIQELATRDSPNRKFRCNPVN